MNATSYLGFCCLFRVQKTRAPKEPEIRATAAETTRSSFFGRPKGGRRERKRSVVTQRAWPRGACLKGPQAYPVSSPLEGRGTADGACSGGAWKVWHP